MPVSLRTFFGIRRRARRIYSRKRSKKKLPETLRSSLQKEFVARTFILPQLKEKFGPSLKALLIVGSAQLGVRKATNREYPSDLDVLAVVDSSVTFCKYPEFRSSLGTKCSSLGVRLNLMFKEVGSLKQEGSIESPFQVIFGKSIVEEALGKGYETSQHEKKEKYKSKPKYAGR